MANLDLSLRQPQGFVVGLGTLGCKTNQSEMEELREWLTARGYGIVDAPDPAHLYVINTCTVTQRADGKSRHLIRLVHGANPAAPILVTGCYAQRARGEIRLLAGVESVVGVSEKGALGELVQGLMSRQREQDTELRLLSPSGSGRTRALVKIQDGCNCFCSFCIVPFVRGRPHSLPSTEVVRKIRAKVDDGYQEIVLTGTNIGSYGDGGPESGDQGRTRATSLPRLVEQVTMETNPRRLRLSSIHPKDISEAFLRLWEDSRLCRHFHLALQSGCERTLQRMNRGYGPGEFARAVELIRSRFSEAAITTDVMVGFPGEDDVEFEESCLFCREMGFSRIHVFQFSPRPGTVAARMPRPVEAMVKQERARRLRKVGQESAQAFRRRFIGRRMSVLYEAQGEDGCWEGITNNYIRVRTRAAQDLHNRLLPTLLLKEDHDGLWGVISGDGNG